MNFTLLSASVNLTVDVAVTDDADVSASISIVDFGTVQKAVQKFQ